MTMQCINKMIGGLTWDFLWQSKLLVAIAGFLTEPNSGRKCTNQEYSSPGLDI